MTNTGHNGIAYRNDPTKYIYINENAHVRGMAGFGAVRLRLSIAAFKCKEESCSLRFLKDAIAKTNVGDSVARVHARTTFRQTRFLDGLR
jgi:hypothetical protein